MTMRLLADENVDRPIVLWLRERGHDVVEVAVVAAGAADAALVKLSRDEHRVLLTFDRDIGRILRADPSQHPGVVYLRLRGVGADLWSAFSDVWPIVEPLARGHFVTVRNSQVRRRPLPFRAD